MPNSMTGFGRGAVSVEDCRIQVEIRSVNNRYCDIQVRMPRALMPLEPALRQQITEAIGRGKLDVFVSLEDRREEARNVRVDHGLAVSYAHALEELGAYMDRPYYTNIRDLLDIDGLVQVQDAQLDTETLKPLLTEATEQAISQLQAARQAEGERLLPELLERVENLEAMRAQVLEQAPRVVELFRTRLETKLREYLQNREVDESRLLTEVALFADKSDISEELTRLESHLQLLRQTFAEEGPVGKKLDFVIQELNREVNTTGSKANDAEITRIVVDMKCEVEKLREQIQNLE